MSKDFVSLHTHSDNSLLDGYGTVEEYVERTLELGQRGLGISDHGGVLGVHPLIKASQQAGITAVPGCEFYVAPENPEGAMAQRPVFYSKEKGQKDVSGRGAYLHMTVWAVNNTGLSNLFKLSTLSWDQSRYYMKPRIDFDLLAEHSEGLVVATGCPSSEISTRFRLGQTDKAYEYARRLKDVFEDRLYVEIMEHGMKEPLERDLLKQQMKLAQDLELELLATNDAHYTRRKDHEVHEIMLASQSKSYMSEAPLYEGGKRFAFEGQEYFLKSSDEMAELFPEEDFPRALSNTLVIAEMAQDISLSYNPDLRPKPVLPREKSEESYFRELIKRGMQKRYGDSSDEVKITAKENIKKEFDVFKSSDYIGYMLTVYEYLNWARETHSTRNADGEIIASATGPGRGSVAGSTIAYCMEISDVDPIRHELIFERFLSAGRGNVYEIVYDDGTVENLVASEKKPINSDDEEWKYIHQLQPGDIVLEDSSDDSEK